MAKITVLEQKTFEGKPSGFKVTLDNGTTGNLQEKESDKGLRVGDEVNVTLIPYTSKKGVTSNLLGLRLVGAIPSATATAPIQASAQPLRPAIHVGAGKSKEELRVESTWRVWEKLMDGVYVDRIDLEAVTARCTEYTRYMWSMVDEAFTSK